MSFPETRTPEAGALPAPFAAAAMEGAQRLAAAGFRAWIVGGAVRDLALGRRVKDIDLVSAATPDEAEAVFESSVGVGRAFGIVVVRCAGIDIELATLRRERGHSDARRPDEVEYTDSIEEDARRRDFTCNALFLDPLTDELADPTGGLADLRAGLLRTVGEPGARFAEDGLRLLRMARFQGALGLAPAPGLHDAARAALPALSGVSAERVLGELERIFGAPGVPAAIGTLFDCGILESALPEWRARAAGSRDWDEVQALRRAVFDALPDPCGARIGLATLLEVGPLDPRSDEHVEAGAALVELLRSSRKRRTEVVALWRLRAALAELEDPGCARSRRVRALRDAATPDAFTLEAAWRRARSSDTSGLDALRAWFESLTESELRPAPWISAADLARAGLEPGPRFGELLREAEDAQIDGAFGDADGARAWLARVLQDGGKTRRNQNEMG
ncbi:MAG: CCA tRNA nucleotidyltransferase [bacterium]|nr:CCA tRNA nucleotidyltransferase [bacterium]